MNELNEDIEQLEKELEQTEKTIEETIESEDSEEYEIIEDISLIDKIKNFWNNSSKGMKALIILVPILVITLIVLGIILLTKEDNPKDKTNNKIEENIVIENDNYIYENGSLKLLKDDEEVGTYKCKNEDAELCYLAYMDNETKLNEYIVTYEDGSEVQIPSKVYNNYVFIVDGEKDIFLYDIKKEEVVNTVSSIKEEVIDDSSYIIVKDDLDKYGMYDVNDDMDLTLDIKYDYIGRFEEQENLVIYEDEESYLVDPKGKSVSETIPGEIKSYNEDYLVQYQYKNYMLLDLEGKELSEEKYDYIELKEDYYNYVIYNELYLSSYEGIKYNQLGIKLQKDDFTYTAIIDESGEVIKNICNYTTEKEENIINVKVCKEDSIDEFAIDTNDAKISNNLIFHSYYDGYLYFYEDPEKEKVLGSYKCTNKNDTTKESLTTCLPASDANFSNSYDYYNEETSSGILPIINKRYVFISDKKEGTGTDSVVLYDLVDNKTVSKYSGVDIIDTLNDKLTHLNTDGIDLIAMNTKFEFGVINISTTPTSVIAFNYQYISKVNGGYTLKSDDLWDLVLGEDRYYGFAGPILKVNKKNNLVVIEKNQKDYIYDFNNNLISNGFESIVISDNYYAGINSSKVNIYTIKDGNKETNIMNHNVDNESNSVIFKSNGTVDILENGKFINYELEVSDVIYGS